MPDPSRRRRYAHAIWLAMVNDEAPDDETLTREGCYDAADAVLKLVEAELDVLEGWPEEMQ